MRIVAPSVISRGCLQELHYEALRAPPGDFVEVGVYRGGSAQVLATVAEEQHRRLFLFDTFTGIPYQGAMDHHRPGDFGDTSLEEVKRAVPSAIIVDGVFPDTLPRAEQLGLGKVALAHVDCDQYQSVLACCVELAPRMLLGGVMVFDDYDCLTGARMAVEERFHGKVEFSARGKARVRF